MNKFKTTFLRTHHTRTTSDERRSQLFAKKLNAAQLPAFDDARPDDAPTVDLGDLSQPEQTAYSAWWKDLDPFSLGQLDIEAVRTFLSSCGLSDEKLEQIFGLFKNAPGGITESQFYAMLRLIAHAQNGRSISRDMVFLGAPVPRFRTNAIDALIKPTAAGPSSSSSGTAVNAQATPQQYNSATADTCNVGNTWSGMGAQTSRNSWYQPSMTHSSASQPTQPARPTSWYYGQSSSEPAFPSVAESVMTPSLAYTNTLHPNNGTASAAFAAAAVPSVDTTTYHRNSSHYINPAFAPLTQPLHPSQTISQSSSTAKQEQRHIYTHSRSRSVPYSVPPPEPPVSENRDVFAFDTIGASMSKQQQQQQQQQQARPSPLVSRASMDADSFQRLSSSIDTGQSLLLTKYYVPPKASNNPFENDTIAESPPVSDHNTNNSNSNSIVTPPPEPSSSSSSTAPHTTTTALERSPFADLQESASLSSSDTTPRLPLSISSAQPKRTTPAWPGINDRPNKENVYPPPVPPQSTKPAFPKYARNTFPNLLRRTQSYKDPFETTPIQGTGSLLFSTNPWSSTDASSSPTAPAVKLFRHRSDGSTLTARR